MIDAPLYDYFSSTFDGGWEMYYSIALDQMMIRNNAIATTINGLVGYFKPSNGFVNVASRTETMTAGTWYTL